MKWKQITAGILALAMLPSAGLTAYADTAFSRYKHMWSITTQNNSSNNPARFPLSLTSEHYAVMEESLSNIDLHAMNRQLGSYHSVGYGMAATSLLATHGLIPYGEYRAEEEMTIPGLFYMTKAGITDKMYSLIYYYQMLEESTAMQQYIANQKLTTTSTERLQMLVELAEAGTPAIVSVNSLISTNTVLAYKTEYGSYEWDGVTYDGKIEVYDPRYQISHTSFIYFNSQDWSWCIPTGSYGSANGHEIGYVCADPDIVNSGGLHQGTDTMPDSDFVNILNYNNWDSSGWESCQFSAIDYVDGTWTMRDTAPEDGMFSDNTFYYMGNAVGTAFTNDAQRHITGEMQYEGSVQYIEAYSVSQFVTAPAGYMEISGTDAEYTMQMVFNEGMYTGSWYSMEISGTADKVSLQKTNTGYLMTADDLTNVIASAVGRDAQASLVFSTDADSVLLYEIDPVTIGAAVDTDGDGSYETTIARTGGPSGGTFLMGRNNWLFLNSSSVFGETYDFTESDRALLETTLSNIELYQAGELLNSEFLGSCYGLASLSLLSCYDLIDYKHYKDTAASLFDIDVLTAETESLINYYAMLQFTDEIWQHIAWNMYSKTEEERLQELIDNMEAGIPTMLCYYGAFDYEGNRSGHAVVAYDIEYGEYELYIEQVDENGFFYTPDEPTYVMNGRIRIYDNAMQHDPNTVSYFYFNTEDLSWYYRGVDSKKDGTLCMTASDIDLLNANGKLEGTSYTTTQDFLAIMFTKAIDSEYTVEKITYDTGLWEAADSTDAEIMAFPVFLASGAAGKSQNFTMTDADSGYVMTLTEPDTLDLEMQYKDTLLLTKAGSASQAVFHPEGYAEISGSTSGYMLEMLFNDGTYTGSWYDFRVSGQGSDASLRRTQEGYILTADNLQDITAEAYGHTAQASLTFSVNTDSVLLYEADANTIGVLADLDGDGIYETPAEDIPEPILGDLNADGMVNSSDAARLLTAAAAAGSGAAGVLTETQALLADVNADGTYDASDAALVLQYAASAGTGNTQTLEEFIAGLAG